MYAVISELPALVPVSEGHVIMICESLEEVTVGAVIIPIGIDLTLASPMLNWLELVPNSLVLDTLTKIRLSKPYANVLVKVDIGTTQDKEDITVRLAPLQVTVDPYVVVKCVLINMVYEVIVPPLALGAPHVITTSPVEGYIDVTTEGTAEGA